MNTIINKITRSNNEKTNDKYTMKNNHKVWWMHHYLVFTGVVIPPLLQPSSRVTYLYPKQETTQQNTIYGMMSLHVFDNNIVIFSGYYDNVYECLKCNSFIKHIIYIQIYKEYAFHMPV